MNTKKFTPRFPGSSLRLFSWILVVLASSAFFGSHAYSQITSVMPASRCGSGTLTLSATATSGSITWYSTPFNGTALYTGADFTTPTLSASTTYYVDALDGSGCSLNTNKTRVAVDATVRSSLEAAIFYSSSAFCKSVMASQQVMLAGPSGGTYTYTGSGTLSLDATTGAIVPGSSSTGTYTVTYTVTADPGCTGNTASTDVTITPEPVTPAISYSGSPLCTSNSPVSVNQTGTPGGSYSASPSGLSIDATSGQINPAASLGGTYTVTYLVAGSGGCDPVSATASVIITALPLATISYAGTPFCINLAAAQAVTLTGTSAYTGGSYSYTGSGLTLNASTGDVTPSSSNPGIYTVTYTIPASAGCALVPVSTTVDVKQLPSASIGGTETVCQNAASPDITFTGSFGDAPYTFTYNVNGGLNQTIISGIGQTAVTLPRSTVSPGAYTYSLTHVADAYGCENNASGTAMITVTASPLADFVYTGSPFCKTGSALPGLINGGTAGTFSGTGVTFVNSSTGEIDLATTPAGSYTVRNTLASCGGDFYESTITINDLPSAAITGTLNACTSTSLTATTNASSPVYTWYFNDAVISGQIASTLECTSSGNYKVKVSDAVTGCEFTSSTAAVTVNPLPVISISGNPVACISTTLTAIHNVASPAYAWYKDNVVINGAASSTFLVSESGSYKVMVTNTQTGCANTSDAASITINPLPEAGIIAPVTSSMCLGAPQPAVTFSGTAGTPPFTFTYNINNGSDQTVMTVSGSSVALNVSTGSAGNYIYTLTKVRDASLTSCEQPLNSTTTVTVVNDPVWTNYTLPSPATICDGSPISFNVDVSGGLGGTIKWIRSDNINPGVGTEVEVNSGDAPGPGTWYYRPQFIPSGSGCDLSDGTQSAVTVNAIPLAPTGLSIQIFCSGNQ